MQNQITLLSKDMWIWEETSLSLQEKFLPFLEQAQEWDQKARAIVVTDINQKDEMQEARMMRLEVKAFRVKVENVRKELKEESLRKWQAIDKVANIIKAVIEPIEEHLELQEKYALVQDNNRKLELKQTRLNLLAPFEANTEFVKLDEMTDEQFNVFLEESKTNYDLKIADIERQRLQEIEDAKEKDKLRTENEKLKLESDLKDKEILRQREESEKAEKEKAEQEAKNKADQEAKKQLEADSHYKAFLNSHWCNEDTKSDYTTKKIDDCTIILYKKVAVYEILPF